MTRLIKILAGIAVLAGLVMAVAPWTVSSRALTAAVADQLRHDMGIDLTVDGRTTIAFLPVPRLKFEVVTVRGAGGVVLARGGQIRGRLKLLPLLTGQIELAELSISNSRIAVLVDKDGRTAWEPTFAALRARIAGDPDGDIRRLIINHSSVAWSDERSGANNLFRDVNLVANWSGAGDAVEIGGTFDWRGEAVHIALTELVPSALADGRDSPVELRLSARLGRVTLVANANDGRAGPWLSGRSSFETKSLRDLVAWTGAELPLGPYIGPASLDGEFKASGPGVSWPSVKLTLGAEKLEGAVASRIEAGRLALTGTLAADTLDLSGFLAPFAQAIAPNGGWSWEPLSLSGAAAADLDLRLSATSARVGPAKLSDVALNVLIKPGRLEAALGRAGLADGSVKGRLLLVSTPDGVDLKANGNAQGLDAAALMTNLSGSNWIAGTASGQFTLEAAGPTAAEMAQRASGRATIAVKQGEFVGLALDDALKRFERQPLSASLNLRSGRTPFREAQATLSLTDGVGEISDASFTAAALKGRVRGRIVAPERSIVAKAAVESLAPVTEGKLSPALAFEISGTWGDLSILPDAKALIERSGAARLLLAPHPLPPPIAPVQIESAIQ